MQNRRDFLKTAALAAFGSGLVARQALAGESLLSTCTSGVVVRE